MNDEHVCEQGDRSDWECEALLGRKRIAALEALTTTKGRGLLEHVEELERQVETLTSKNEILAEDGQDHIDRAYKAEAEVGRLKGAASRAKNDLLMCHGVLKEAHEYPGNGYVHVWFENERWNRFVETDDDPNKDLPKGEHWVPLADDDVRHSGTGQRCDMEVGPCACGAWHNKGENR